MTVDSTKLQPSPQVEITEYPVPDYSPIQSISIISPNEIYVFTDRKVYFFNGSKFNELYKLNPPMVINVADCNGNFIVLVSNDFPKLFPDYKCVILKIRKNNGGVTISRIIEFKIPFTQTAGAIKFLNNNILFLAGVMEYGFLNINAILRSKNYMADEKNFQHYAFPVSASDALYLKKGFSNQLNIYPFFIADKIYYLQNNDSKPSLNFLCKIPADKKFNAYTAVQEVSIADTNFGCIKFYDRSPYLFFSRNNDGNLNYFFEDTLKLNTGRRISFDHVQKILTFSPNNIWSFTKEGEILHNVPSDKFFNKMVWNKVGAIANMNNYNAAAYDSNIIYLIGTYLTKIKVTPLQKSYNHNQESKVNKGNLFELMPLDQVSQNYGVGVLDVNNDNREDLYLVELESGNKFILNPGPFARGFNFLSTENNIANQRGATGRSNISVEYSKLHNFEVGLAIGDFSNSGSDDIYLTTLEGNNILLKNNGSGYFRDATDEFNLDKDIGRSEGAVLSDADNDGYLDIFTTSFQKSNSLFINNKGIKFFDATKKANLISLGASICAAFADINNDGYPDLYVGNWMRSNKFYLNNGNGIFKDITKQSGTGLGNFHKTNSVLFADFNNDGLPDLFVGNRGTPNELFLNLGGGNFKDVSAEVGLTDTLFTYGAAFGDFDNDGYLDLFVDYLGGVKIYKNMMGLDGGKLYFEDMTKSFMEESVTLKGYNTGTVTLDYDNDGDLDIFVCQYEGISFMLKNLLNDSYGKKANFLEVKLIGSQSNRDAVGAKLKLFRNDTLIAFREVCSGYGYASSSSKIQHFGLGNGKGNFKLQVTFPMSGVVKNLAINPNAFISVHEHEGIAESYFFIKKALIRFLFGREIIIWLIKLALLFFILSLMSNLKKFHPLINENKNMLRYIKPKIPAVIFLSIFATYFLFEFLAFYTQNLSMSAYYYMSNSRNVFFEDILPFIPPIFFGFVYLTGRKNSQIKRIGAENILENLYTILRRFEHGEGMLMNLNRLSLFIENIVFESKFEMIPSEEIFNRISGIIEEYRTSVIPELKNIFLLCGQIGSKKPHNAKAFNYRNAGNAIYNESITLLSQVEEFQKTIISIEEIESWHEKLKLIKDDFNNSMKGLKSGLYNLREEVKKIFSSDVSKAIEFTVKKFEPIIQERISIAYNKHCDKANAIIQFSELSEILSIIIKNSLDELNRIEPDSGIINISSDLVDKKVTIKIEDNGEGIEPGKREIIFNEGYTTKKGSHGFGLKYVKKCLEKYEGKISVEQSILGGACFVIELNQCNQ